jgi:hypothetical protein
MNVIRLFKQYFNGASRMHGAQTASNTSEPAQVPDHDATRPMQHTQPMQHSPTEDATTETAKDTDSLKSPSGNGYRPKLPPKHQKDLHRKPTTPYTRPDSSSQIVFEVFKDPNDPMPKGYMGTIGGARICRSTVEDYCPCGTGGGHYLICGHTVVGDAACGANCKSGPRDEQPFNCPQCRDIVNAIFKNKLTYEERSTVELHHKKKDVLAIPLCIEYISKYLSAANGNIAATVVGMLTAQYGRECQAVPEEKAETKTLAEMFAEHHSTLEQSTRAKLAEDKLGPMNAPQKRKNKVVQVDNSEEVTPSADDVNKKQKRTLESHREPVTDQTRGMKRTAEEEDFSDADTLVDSDDAPSATKTNKKQKQKLETHREPIPRRTHGMKRKLAKSGDFANYNKPAKRVMLAFDKVSKDASFLPIPLIVTDTLGQLVRKRGQMEQLESEGNKRVRDRELLPGYDAEVVMGGSPEITKSRMSLSEWANAVDDSDEL